MKFNVDIPDKIYNFLYLVDYSFCLEAINDANHKTMDRKHYPVVNTTLPT